MARRTRYYSVLLAMSGGTATASPFGIASSTRSWMIRNNRIRRHQHQLHDPPPSRGRHLLIQELVQHVVPRGGSEASVYDQDDDVEESEEEEEEEEEEEAPAESAKTNSTSSIPADPVIVTIRTASGSAVLDETVELETVVRSRTVRSIKESISKKLPAKPPVSTIALTLDGRLLADDELVNDIVEEVQEEEEESTEQSSSSNIILTMEAITPVDPKFLPELERKIPDLTSEELLQAYAANEAALYQNSLLLETLTNSKGIKDNDDDEEEGQQPQQETTTPAPVRVNTVIRNRLARIRSDLETTVLATDNAKQLLADHVPPSQIQPSKIEIRGQRVRTPGQSSLRGILQRNLNVDWHRTGRAIFACLFFGVFGGRTALSKAILLLCVPLLIIVQARPVKFVLTQGLYFVLFHPPSIVLSLLPAPQQTILSMEYDEAMKAIYGDELKTENDAFQEEEMDDSDQVDDDDAESSDDAPEFGDIDEEDTDDEYDSEEYE